MLKTTGKTKEIPLLGRALRFFNQRSREWTQPYYYLEDVDESELSIAVVWRKGAYLYQAAKELIRIANQIDPLEEQARGIQPNVTAE